MTGGETCAGPSFLSFFPSFILGLVIVSHLENPDRYLFPHSLFSPPVTALERVKRELSKGASSFCISQPWRLAITHSIFFLSILATTNADFTSSTYPMSTRDTHHNSKWSCVNQRHTHHNSKCQCFRTFSDKSSHFRVFLWLASYSRK